MSVCSRPRKSRFRTVDLNEAREQEARRIASALHDQSSQLLVLAHMQLETISASLPHQQAAKVAEVQHMLHVLQQQLRGLSHELRPPMLDDMGLAPTLEFLVHGLRRRYGIAIALDVSMLQRYPLMVETCVYRFVSEALTNVGKHARASHAWVQIRDAGRNLVCMVEDNGVGFHVHGKSRAQFGLGLVSLKERFEAIRAAFNIISEPGGGTVLMGEIPLAAIKRKTQRKKLKRLRTERESLPLNSTGLVELVNSGRELTQ